MPSIKVKKCCGIKYKKHADLYITADRKLMRIFLKKKSYFQKKKKKNIYIYIYIYILYIYTDQNYKRNTFIFAPIFHELNSKI